MSQRAYGCLISTEQQQLASFLSPSAHICAILDPWRGVGFMPSRWYSNKKLRKIAMIGSVMMVYSVTEIGTFSNFPLARCPRGPLEIPGPVSSCSSGLAVAGLPARASSAPPSSQHSRAV